MAAPCPSSSGSTQPAEAICGEIQAVDFFEQTFTVEHPDGQVETIPFSRWTNFYRMARSKSGEHREAVEPSQLEIGDEVQVRLDANAATAERVQVLDVTGTRASTGAKHVLAAAVAVR